MTAWTGFLVPALLALAAGSVPATEVFVPYREVQEDGTYVDWLDGHVGAMGRTISNRDLKVKLYFSQARQKAEDMGKARILRYLRQFPIDGEAHLGDSPELIQKVKLAMEKIAASVEVSQPSTLKALVRFPLHGDNGLISLVLPPTAPGAAELLSPPAPVAADGSFTGLVVDATKLLFASPSLLPRITDEKGRTIYDIERVDVEHARERGLAGFASRVEMRDPKLRREPREGSNPLKVRAVSIAGPGRTEFVISEADAEVILEEAARAPFLSECRVLVLMPPARPQPTAQPPARPEPLPRPRELEKPR